MPTWELYANGRVQGVGFRYFVWKTASELGIKGYVNNQWDGSVKIVAQADEHLLQAFKQIIAQGNRYAKVRELQIYILESAEKYNDFEIR
ncbi:MAG TPA: acylphosphatase [Candidatus Cloacimonas sp.]|nr:acylphosphatase [Candidatus Cloacimonas sp.]HPS60814.1 acylphosphatase [Candidatus Cloacimonas sp.]